MMKKTVYMAVLLLACQNMWAQNKNLDQTVQVTADYDASAIPGERKAEAITVPDSLYRFNVNFDYSGFEKAYKGGTEFNPFRTELQINTPVDTLKSFYMKVGAGYTLNPELELSWAFKRYGRFKMGLFARNSSYYGQYWEPYVRNGRLDGTYSDRMGAQSLTVAGLDGRADWEKMCLNFALWYDGVIANDSRMIYGVENRFYNGGQARLTLASNRDKAVSGWDWRLKMYGGYGSDLLKGSSLDSSAGELDFGADGMVCFNVSNHFIELGMDFDRTQGGQSGDLSSYVGWDVGIRPKYIFSGKRFSLGVGATFLITGTEGNAFTNRNFDVFPLLDMNWRIVPGYFEMYAASDMKARTFGVRAQALEHQFYIPDITKHIEKDAKINAGFRGDIDGAFEYDAAFVYDWLQNSSQIQLFQRPGGNVVGMICHQEMQDLGCDAELKGHFAGFTLGCDARYRWFINEQDLTVVPSALSAGLSLGYDYLTRISAVVGARYNSDSYSRSNSGTLTVPYWVDLYAGASYRITSKFSVYLKGENLLNWQQNAIPLYSRKGIAVTGGIILNL